ncbi:hypothetical protein KP509_35G029500 [Ceratopteris richardii]|nr:hypothetical protein KP509_35G029500 [Ceratopteris richardii]
MVDGDFKRYDGKWHVQAGSRASTTLLQYEVNVVPKIIFPTALVESIIKSDLPKNLCAIAKRAEAEDYHKSPCFSDNHTLAWASKVQGHGNVTMGGVDLQQSALGRTCRLDNNCMVDEIHFRRLDDLLENGGVHRQVVASITVKASSKDVWSVLTEYETLPEFVPNLVNSKILSREGERVRLLQEGCKCLLYMVLHARVILDLWEEPEQGISFRQIEGDFDSFEGTWTLHQLGSQHTVLKYAVDTKIWKNCILAESLVEEVIYEDLPSNLCAIRDRVEKVSKNRSSGLLGSSESSILSEFEMVHEKIETMRCEDGDGAGNHADISMQSDTSVDQKMKSVRNQPLVECLSSDYGLMDREIRNFIATHGQEGVMPMRKDLRQLKRHDIETAIRVMGGYRTVAARMKLSLAYKERKPFGYWDDLQNLQNEVIAVQKQLGCDAKVLPSRLSIERLGKYDLARALERWGGAKEAARILGLKTKGSKKQDRHRKEKKMRQSKIALLRQTQNIPARLSHAMVDPGRPSKKKSAKSVVASEMSARTDQTSSENISHQISRKAVFNALTDITDYSEKSNDLFSGSLVKGKKMPYKTGVPQESSKWLTLVSDAEQQDVQEE